MKCFNCEKNDISCAVVFPKWPNVLFVFCKTCNRKRLVREAFLMAEDFQIRTLTGGETK